MAGGQGYQVRKRIEEVFGWMKSIGLLHKLRHRGLKRVVWIKSPPWRLRPPLKRSA